MLRYISHLSFSTRATLHLTLSPPPSELRGDFLFLSLVRVRVLISSFLPIQLGNSFFYVPPSLPFLSFFFFSRFWILIYIVCLIESSVDLSCGGRKSKSDLVLQLNEKESQRRLHAKKGTCFIFSDLVAFELFYQTEVIRVRVCIWIVRNFKSSSCCFPPL